MTVILSSISADLFSSVLNLSVEKTNYEQCFQVTAVVSVVWFEGILSDIK
jgi:hypothetical protein